MLPVGEFDMLGELKHQHLTEALLIVEGQRALFGACQ